MCFQHNVSSITEDEYKMEDFISFSRQFYDQIGCEESNWEITCFVESLSTFLRKITPLTKKKVILSDNVLNIDLFYEPFCVKKGPCYCKNWKIALLVNSLLGV